MTSWTSDELARIGDATELTIQTQRPDGTLRRPLPIWVVRDGDRVYGAAYTGPMTIPAARATTLELTPR